MAPDRNALGNVHDPFADDVPARQIDAPPARTMMEVAQRMNGGAPATPRGTAIVPVGDGVRLGRFTMTAVGLIANGPVSESDWLDFRTSLKKVQKSTRWADADWLVMGERVHGKTYEQMSALTGVNANSLRQYAYVARNVQMSIRIDKLSFAHHQLVASRSPEEQASLLRHALENRLSVGRFRLYLEGREPEKTTAVARFQGRLVGLYDRNKKRKHAERREMALLLRQMADALEAETPPGTEDEPHV